MITRLLPFIECFRGYTVARLRTDAVAGLTVALVLIPQSMAYAQLAGLPAYYGLYAAFLPPIVGSMFGSSLQLATGPVAVVSLMTAAALGPLATAGSSGYIAYAVLLALMVGVFQFLLGVLRLGLVVNFLSHPVVNGFTNAAAIIIATSQLSKIFGVSVDESEHHFETIARVVDSAWHYTHWPTVLMAVLAFGIMVGLRRVSPRIPGVLVAVVVTTVLSWATGFERNASVPLSAIRSPEAAQRIRDFNHATGALVPLAEQRTVLHGRLEAARRAGDTLQALDVQHELSVLNLDIERLRYEAHVHRDALRRMVFTEEHGADGGGAYVPGTGAGRAWRIRVGSAPIPEGKVAMSGGGAVVGAVPQGLPAFSVPRFDWQIAGQLLPHAIIIALLGFMEAISIAKAMAAKTGQRLDPNQELIGQGLANIVGSVGQSYPVSGSFSRSAVNLQAGATSRLSSVITGFTVVAVLLLFTPLLYHLPQAVLAAVIMMAVVGLINVSGVVHAWRAKWYDGAIAVATFLVTLAFAPHLDKGIMIGVLLSLAVFLYKSMRPTVASLSKAEDDAHRDSAIHGLKECRYVAVVRFDGPLFFANVSHLEDRIAELRRRRAELRHIILVCHGMNDIDASGEETLSLLVDRVRSARIDISLSGVNHAVMSVLQRTHLLAKIGEDHIYSTTDRAVCAVHEAAHHGGAEEVCPLTAVCRLA